MWYTGLISPGCEESLTALRALGASASGFVWITGAVRARWQAAERFYARNQRIVDDTDLVIAFVAPDRTGGTEDTIRRAHRTEGLAVTAYDQAGRPAVLRAGARQCQMRILPSRKALAHS